MTPGEINAMLQNLNNIPQLNEATGATVAVEVRMRLIGELDERVRDKLKEIVANAKRKGKSDKYWDCDLSFLDDTIDVIFHDKLELIERQKIEKFRDLRNALLHGNFVDLMNLMNIPPTGRQISSGERNILESKEIKEAIVSINRNQGCQKILTHAKEVISILDKIIFNFGNG